MQSTKFLLTNNRKRIISSINKTIDDNGWRLVSGDVGSGKTILRDHLVQVWKDEPAKYLILEQPGFQHNQSRINNLMKRMIKIIQPDLRPPGDIESRYYLLKKLLMDTHRTKKKLILILDEFQDNSESTIREIKKIHEISGYGQKHLFSIIAFAKESPKMEGILSGRELGYRVSRSYTKLLTDEELIWFANEYGLTIKDDKTKEYFLQHTHHSPLAIDRIARILRDMKNFSGPVTIDVLRSAFSADRKEQINYYSISLSEIQERYKDNYGQHISKPMISQSMSGQKNTSVAKQINRTTEELIAERSKQQAQNQ